MKLSWTTGTPAQFNGPRVKVVKVKEVTSHVEGGAKIAIRTS
jgi:hypothetical protein